MKPMCAKGSYSRGQKFRHARFRENAPGVLIGDQKHEICMVTRVTKTSVYYRTGAGEGNLYVVDRAKFGDSVLNFIPMGA